MRENGLTYTLTAYTSSGTSIGSVTINPAGFSGAGFFADQDGIIFQSDVETAISSRPQAHGSYIDGAWRSGITGSIKLLLLGSDAANRQALQDSLMTVLDAMLGDDGGYGVISWTPQDGSAQRSISGLQLVQPAAWGSGGGTIKTVSFIVQSERPFAESAATNADTTALTSSGGGFTIPLTLPVSFASGGAGQATLTNSGSVDSYPQLQVYGPVSAFTITLTATGYTSKRLVFPTASIASGDYWTIDLMQRTITLGAGTSSMISALDLSQSTWFGIPPGTSTLQLTGSSYDANTKLRALMTSAWS